MKTKLQIHLLAVLSLLLAALPAQPAHAAGILYVTPGGTGDCSSWANACMLQAALGLVISGE